MKLSEDASSRCRPWVIIKGIKLCRVYLCCPTNVPQSSWIRCWSFSLRTRNPDSSSGNYLWTDSQLIFEHICSLNSSVTLGEWLCVLTSYGQFLDAASLLYLISARTCMLCLAGTHQQGLELVVLFLDQTVFPQFQRMIEDSVLPEFAATTAPVGRCS